RRAGSGKIAAMNLAIRDVKYRLGRFVLTAIGVGLLLATVMAMGGIYRGMVEDALSIVRSPGADLWVVQKDTNGPFAETSRVPDDLYRVVRAVHGVREASPIAFQSVQLDYRSVSMRTQLIGYRPGNLGAPPAVAAGRPLAAGRYEMVLDGKSGIPLGARLALGRMIFTVVGLTEGIVSSSGDSTAYVSLQDAQELQFLKANEAVRNERARLQADLRADPALAGVSSAALGSVIQNTNLANAILVRLEPWADPAEVARQIERWNHYRAMTTAEQEDVLAKNVIERARQQILLFRIILLAVSTVIIALIIYTMTMEKSRDIATLKIIGAANFKIGGMILQESLALGLLGYAFGALLIQLTFEKFPRRVAIVAFDQTVLFAIVAFICVAASIVGIRRALAIDPTTAMAGGA
ncbi:MAG TPA: ABC transporter permease, partial [Candidatus Binatia bacterium]|nr:ABC transporter permease [Candidatus Binatia bacterium]